jgi:hypothetical protein
MSCIISSVTKKTNVAVQSIHNHILAKVLQIQHKLTKQPFTIDRTMNLPFVLHIKLPSEIVTSNSVSSSLNHWTNKYKTPFLVSTLHKLSSSFIFAKNVTKLLHVCTLNFTFAQALDSNF